MRHRSSCRVVINPIFGNATIKKIITSRGSQLERRRKMEEIVSQIEKDFDDLDSIVCHKPTDAQGNNNNNHTILSSSSSSSSPSSLSSCSAVVAATKIKRSSIRTKLRKGEDIVASLQSQLSTLNSSQRAVVESRLISKWEKLMKSGEVSKTVLSAYNGGY